ncbi:MAG: ATP-binding cassette domain-containing protein [Desulfovibrio sp.]|nr:ATP-binding cassette domain-containing protein [Desulfovibrio sp.]
MSVIVAKGLHKAYQGFSPVLRGVDISVEEGELVAIMGPSGCGKSTMLHILGMLHAPDQGSLRILDTDVLAFSREEQSAFRRENMGFVMQSNNLFEHSTVFENVEFPLIYAKVQPEERWERVILALDLVHLSQRVHYRSNRLSGGEQQRVAIARAMVNKPRILLADEPTGALDARTSRLIMEIFRSLCHASGVAMVMVTHDPKMAEFCDSIYTLEEGLLVSKKHELPVRTSSGTSDFLAPPKPRMRGAMIAKSPRGIGTSGLLGFARMLYKEGLLTRIYTLSATNQLSAPEDYSLPLAIRRLGLFSTLRKSGRLLTPSFWRFLRSLPMNASLLSRMNAVLAGFLFAEWAKEEHLDFLFAGDGEHTVVSAYVASALSGIPFGVNAAFSSVLSQRQIPFLMEHASLVRVKTRSIETRIRSLLPATEVPIFHVPDPLLFEAVSSRPPIDTSDHVLTIAAAGPLTPPQGFDVLLQACALLKNETQIAVKIAGKGPELSSLKALTKSLGGLNMVSFLGELPLEHMEDFFQSSDIFVVPQRMDMNAFCDDIPQALSLAMSFALPIVATDLPVLGEVLTHGQNALIIPQNDPEALARAILTLSKNPETAARLGEKASSTIRQQTEHPEGQRLLTEKLLAFAKNPPLHSDQ